MVEAVQHIWETMWSHVQHMSCCFKASHVVTCGQVYQGRHIAVKCAFCSSRISSCMAQKKGHSPPTKSEISAKTALKSDQLGQAVYESSRCLGDDSATWQSLPRATAMRIISVRSACGSHSAQYWAFMHSCSSRNCNGAPNKSAERDEICGVTFS